MLDTTDSLLLVGIAVILGPILLAAAMIYAINRRPTQPGEDNRHLSGAKAGISIAALVIAVLGAIYLFASNDPQRTTVTPTVERAPSNGLAPGRPVTPQEKGG